MKKCVCLLLVLLTVLCGCAEQKQEEKEVVKTVGVFSYAAVELHYEEGMEGVFRTGFRNTRKTPVENAQQAFDLAKNECIVEYDAFVVSFDEATDMYCVCFYTNGTKGDTQLIYLNSDGVTQLVVFE